MVLDFKSMNHKDLQRLCAQKKLKALCDGTSVPVWLLHCRRLREALWLWLMVGVLQRMMMKMLKMMKNNVLLEMRHLLSMGLPATGIRGPTTRWGPARKLIVWGAKF